jgi:hypothetical protein
VSKFGSNPNPIPNPNPNPGIDGRVGGKVLKFGSGLPKGSASELFWKKNPLDVGHRRISAGNTKTVQRSTHSFI